jgi:hypothetical protein
MTINNPDNSLGTTDPQIMTALFHDKESAERGFEALRTRGYTEKEISVLMSDETRKLHFSNSPPASTGGKMASEGAGVGSAIGGTAGAVLATILAVAAPIVIPGLGLVVTGPIVALLAGAGAGGVAGALIGSMIGLGISHEQAKAYEAGLRNGGIVLAVRPRSSEDARQFEQTWINVRREPPIN